MLRFKITNFTHYKAAVSDVAIVKDVKKHLKLRGAKDVSMEIEIVGIKKMSSLNKTFMGKSGPTDVLSFPLDVIPGENHMFIGTIVICSDIIDTVSKLNETNYADEFLFRVRHGIDHLLGIHHK